MDHFDVETARADLARYEARLDVVHREVERLLAEREGLQPVVQGLRRLLSTAPPTQRRLVEVEQTQPQPDLVPAEGSEAIVRLLTEARQGEVWTFDEIFRGLEQRGWTSTRSTNPKSAARAALQRLVNAETVERTGRSRFRMRPSPTEGDAPPDASATGDEGSTSGEEAR
jgi:hypothetical protein